MAVSPCRHDHDVQYDAQCLDLGIALCKPGTRFSAIGKAISGYARQHGYSVSPEFCGHGVGSTFHEEPVVFHVPNQCNIKMQPGHTFTIEPILLEGEPDWMLWSDGWTASSRDGGRAAQYEHTILITGEGCEILTL